MCMSIPQHNVNYMYIKISRPDTTKEFEDLFYALKRMADEGHSFGIYSDEDHKQIILIGSGIAHLRNILKHLKDHHGLNLSVEEPQILYKTTIRQSATAEGRYIRQASSRDSYGHCWLEIKPLSRGEGYVFINDIKDESIIPSNYISPVDGGITAQMNLGLLGRFPIVDIEARLFDGSYNEIDSSMMAYKIAASLGFRDAFNQALPVVLEPWVRIIIPVVAEDIIKITSELQLLGARNVEQTEISGREVIVAEIAVRLLFPKQQFMNKYSIGGQNNRDTIVEFLYYDELPTDLQEEIIEQSGLTDAYNYGYMYDFFKKWEPEEIIRRLQDLVDSYWKESQ
ncbi:Elongation factor G [compost metagenome]